MATPILPVDTGALLNEARKALHQLMIGQSARVFVDQNGERVEYTAANRGALITYIQGLEKPNGTSVLGPMRIVM